MSEKNKLKILLVEDDYLVLEMIIRLLNELGYKNIYDASNGKIAIEKACSLKPDIIFMDIEMPEMNGIEALKIIQAKCPVPIIMLSAFENQKLINEATKAGASAYLLKPLYKPYVERAIAIAIARHKDLMEVQKLNSELKEEIEKRKKAEANVKKLLSEKEMLLKEVHHRIKNNMHIIQSLLSMQSDTIKIPEAVLAFQDAIARVESMGVLYDKLYRSESYEVVEIEEYLSQLIGDIVEMFPGMNNISIEKQIDTFHIGTKTIFALGIIINELLTNTFKYAFTGRDNGVLKISVKKEDSHITLIFEDNGIGISELKQAEGKGFGMKLIDMLVDQIDGSYKIENVGGTKYIIEFEQVS